MQKVKRNNSATDVASSPPKKAKTEQKPKFSKPDKPKKSAGKFSKPGQENKFKKSEHVDKFNKSGQDNKFKKTAVDNKFKKPGQDKFKKPGQGNKPGLQEKPADWNEFKKKKKEVREKRKQSKDSYDVITKAKQIGEKLRMKKLEGGNEERNKLVGELHGLMGNQGSYVKFVLSHDMARIVQYMLKFGQVNIRQDIAKEIIPATVQMLQSKYGRFCVKRMLKYGNATVRSDCVRACYGHAVKLTSHAVSAPVFEYMYSTWASPADKLALTQEFFGDMYRLAKDAEVKHLRDVYAKSPDMKSGALVSVKGNLSRILNKDLLDSGLVQTVLRQFLEECEEKDRAEMITQLSPHIVVIGNSRDGSRVAMQCIWHGTNKDRKVAMKALKEHVIELCKHEHGHGTIVTLMDSADDTVLLHKMILSEILGKAEELVGDDWGRKALLWLVMPGDTTHFHPQFIKELDEGRKSSSCKKDPEIRRKELLTHSSKSLLEKIVAEPKVWLEQSSRTVVTLAILKSGTGSDLQEALKAITSVIVDSEWTLTEDEKEVQGIEHAGIHMMLKKLAMNDKKLSEGGNEETFGKVVVEALNGDIVANWIQFNRGCFFLLSLYENNGSDVQEGLKQLLVEQTKSLKKQRSTGAKILCKKVLG